MHTKHEADEVWNAGLLACGELIVLLAARFRTMRPGAVLRLISLDPAAMEDVPAWCRLTGHELLGAEPPVYHIAKQKEN